MDREISYAQCTFNFNLNYLPAPTLMIHTEPRGVHLINIPDTQLNYVMASPLHQITSYLRGLTTFLGRYLNNM